MPSVASSRHLAEIFRKPFFVVCAPLVLEEIGWEFRFRGRVILRDAWVHGIVAVVLRVESPRKPPLVRSESHYSREVPL